MNAEKPGLSPVAGPLTSEIIHDQRIADLRARARRHDHGLLVVMGLANGGTRARVVLTLAAARKLVENARERGMPATVALVKFVAVQTSPADLAALLAEVTE